MLLRAAKVEAEPSAPGVGFMDALEDDLNTPRAYAELFAMAQQLEAAPEEDRAHLKGELLASGQLIGFLKADPESWFQGGADPAMRARIDALIAERFTAREAKDWPTADRIRAELTAMNVEVMDNPTGATWRLKSEKVD